MNASKSKPVVQLMPPARRPSSQESEDSEHKRRDHQRRQRQRQSLPTEFPPRTAQRYRHAPEPDEREMEARLQRLEQDGEAWLSTVVSMFERLNSNLAQIHEADNDDDGDDGEAESEGSHEDEAATWEETRQKRIVREYLARQEEERRRRIRQQVLSESSGADDDYQHPEVYRTRRRNRQQHHRHSVYSESTHARDWYAEEQTLRRASTGRSRHSTTTLRAQVDSESAQRQRLRDLDKAVDARIAALSQSLSQRPSRPGSRHTTLNSKHTSRQPLANAVDRLPGRGSIAPQKEELSTLEPLMHELMDSSRLSLEDERDAGEDSDGFVARSDHLFGGF